jgi:Ni,Fe-hydrogenase maturation factor
MKILVLGLGNELFEDDAAGIHDLRMMKEKVSEVSPNYSQIIGKAAHEKERNHCP